MSPWESSTACNDTCGTDGSTDNGTCNLDLEWSQQSLHVLKMFLVPSVLCSAATLLLNPLILITILLKENLRRETRYLLLANVLLADLIFLLFNTFISVCNVTRWMLYRFLCFTMIGFTFTAYCSCGLTFTALVIDTYVAVSFPLHYHWLLSSSRTKKILVIIWLMAAMFPLLVFLLSEMKDQNPLEKQNVCLMLYFGPDTDNSDLVTGVYVFVLCLLAICSSMITYFYIKLYRMTKQSGIWACRCSRARVTLLIHSMLLVLYMVPGVVFAMEIILFKNCMMGLQDRIWLSATNTSMLMLLPRVLSPLLYGIRYREISQSLRSFLSGGRVNDISLNSQG
ncbi:probable G-protein coupled receptor 148 [Rhinatrema bivittatum]|uniref:probable G-protein coupled receptor 148 n=1 Tax=Rhinatrema bivittatum TaxID=194408 RepID=UPI00112DF0F8|nr:probable G-protein coupled receptor 148 [Rhinatrema bivittatum]